MIKLKSTILIISFGVFMAACGPGLEELTATAYAAATATQLARPTTTEIPTSTPETLTEVELGEQLFKTKFLETSGRHCGYCHNVNESESEKVSLIGIASRAGERVGDERRRLYPAIDPRAYHVEGMSTNMPEIFAEILSEEDINHLIAYLMTLE